MSVQECIEEIVKQERGQDLVDDIADICGKLAELEQPVSAENVDVILLQNIATETQRGYLKIQSDRGLLNNIVRDKIEPAIKDIEAREAAIKERFEFPILQNEAALAKKFQESKKYLGRPAINIVGNNQRLDLEKFVADGVD